MHYLRKRANRLPAKLPSPGRTVVMHKFLYNFNIRNERRR